MFKRQGLLDHIWGEGYAVEGHTLDGHICWFRKAVLIFCWRASNILLHL